MPATVKAPPKRGQVKRLDKIVTKCINAGWLLIADQNATEAEIAAAIVARLTGDYPTIRKDPS